MPMRLFIHPHSSTSCSYTIQVAMNKEVVKRSLTFPGDEVLVLHRSFALFLAILTSPYLSLITTDSMPVAHVYGIMPFAVLDYHSEMPVHLAVLACGATLNE